MRRKASPSAAGRGADLPLMQLPYQGLVVRGSTGQDRPNKQLVQELLQGGLGGCPASLPKPLYNLRRDFGKNESQSLPTLRR